VLPNISQSCSGLGCCQARTNLARDVVCLNSKYRHHVRLDVDSYSDERPVPWLGAANGVESLRRRRAAQLSANGPSNRRGFATTRAIATAPESCHVVRQRR
jgi:hypothetical protein